jgi:hypothetical protein
MARRRYSVQEFHDQQRQARSAIVPHAVPTPPKPAPEPDPTTTPHVRSDWSEWSEEQERKRIAANVAEVQKFVENPIYPRELAERIASEYAKVAFPDWRLLKVESSGLLARLVRDQPEMKQREAKQRNDLIGVLRNALPNHLRPLLGDLELIQGLHTDAREAAAFMVGFSLGKKAAKTYVDHSKGIVRTRREPPRQPDANSPALRLTLAE